MKKQFIPAALCALALAIGLLSGCTANAATVSSSAVSAGSGQEGATQPISTASDKVKDFDLDASWDEASSTVITLEGETATVKGSGATAENGGVTIIQGGTYVLRGTLTNGQVLIKAPEADKVRLVLDGMAITNNASSPIYCETADKLLVILADGRENTLTDGSTYTFPDASTDEPNAALFSKADLTINGTGTLKVNANYYNGIGTKDDLILVSGNITVDAAYNAIRGRDSVTVLEADLTLTAGNDGLQANNDTAADKGWIELYGGNYAITAAHDGIQAETDLNIAGGTFTITTGGGSANGRDHAENAGPGGMQQGGFPGGQMPGGIPGQMPDGTAPGAPPEGTTPGAPPDANTSATTNPSVAQTEATFQTTAGQTALLAADANSATGETTDTEGAASDSYKGLKSTGNISITGGTFTINSADDGVHSNSAVSITGGSLGIQTGDDGVHADATLNVGGEAIIDISESYEGLEASIVTISSGSINIVASDDGINAAGGSDADTTGNGFGPDQFTSGSGNLIRIEGGTINVQAGADGLDANGDIEITGGVTFVNMEPGRGVGGDGIIDRDGSFTITGGVLVGAGDNGVVSMGPSTVDSSSQALLDLYYSSTQTAGTLVSVTDASGNPVVSFTPTGDYTCIIVSTPEMAVGESYTVSSGGTSGGNTLATGVTGGAVSGASPVFTATLTSSVTALSDTGDAHVSQMGGGRGGMGGRPGAATTT